MGGSSSTQSTQIPDYIEDVSRLAAQRANQIYEAGRMPFTGIDVVGLNPSEKAAMENVASAASAFGMAVPQGDPFAGMEAQTTNGLTGYSSMPIYISDMERLKEQRPDQYGAFAQLTGFDPITGKRIAPPPPAPVYDPRSGRYVDPMDDYGGAESFSGTYGYGSDAPSPGGFDPLGPSLGGYSVDIGDLSVGIGPSKGGAEGDANGKSIVCTEMYRQTKLDNWSEAMKTWYVYQKKHLTPYHELGYHAVFKPFVSGMKHSQLITKIGAYAAEERTKHLRYVLTKGKSEGSFAGRVICNILEPQMYLAGRIVSLIKRERTKATGV